MKRYFMALVLVLALVTAAVIVPVESVSANNCNQGMFLGGNGNPNNISGGPNNDEIHGAGGNDTLRGLECNDRLYGGTGNDLLIGGPGFDYCNGGPGIDVFVGCEVAVQ